MTTDNKAMANSDPILRELDTLLAAQGKLQFARKDYDEAAATVFGVALLDFMRVHGMEVRRRIVGSTPQRLGDASPQVNDEADDDLWLRRRAAFVQASEAEEASLERSGCLYDPYLPVDAGICAVLAIATPQASGGGKVTDAMVERAAREWCSATLTPFDSLGENGRKECLRDFRRVLESALSAAEPDVALLDEPSQYCYSPDHGDSWYDSPDDADILGHFEADHVGATFDLQVSHWSVTRTFRVTKVADETGDDYQVEPLATAQQVAES